MAECDSLYVKIPIQQEKLNEFFNSRPVPCRLDDDWKAWWDSRQMYGKESLEQIPAYLKQTNREIFDELLAGRSFVSREFYDVEAETWTFLSLFFSENYVEILPMLSLLKNLAIYQKPDQNGIALIYDRYWGSDEVMACMIFSDQKATLTMHSDTQQLDSSWLESANQSFKRIEESVDEESEG